MDPTSRAPKASSEAPAASKPRQRAKYGPPVAIAVAILGISALFLITFEAIPIEGTSLACDWRILWRALRGGVPRYGSNSCLYITPWSLLPALPLGLLPFRISWGLLNLATLGVLVVSVPRVDSHMRWAVGVLLLVTSFPSLRHMADGNLAGLAIGGIVLAARGLSRRKPVELGIGMLLATAKIQEVWLLTGAVGFYVLWSWNRHEMGRLAATVGAVAIPMAVWLGRDWVSSLLEHRYGGSIIDSSMVATASRLGLPPVVIALMWACVLASTAWLVLKSRPSLSREKAGLLVAASLMLSPYAGPHSFLTVFAIGIIPLFLLRPGIGLLLIALTNLPYLTLGLTDFAYQWSAAYWFLLLLVTWSLFALRIVRREIHAQLDREAPALS